MFELRLLGFVRVARDDQPVGRLESRKALASLCYLAVRAQPHTRTHLADLFWGDKTEAQGRGNLSRVLHNLTTLLPKCLHADRETVQLNLDLFWLDVHAFDEFVARNTPDALAAAVELYRDEFMAGIYLDDCPDFEIWLTGERERWRQRVTQLLHDLIQYHTEREEYETAQRFAGRLLAIEPWREEAHRQMMRLLALTDQRAAALAQYETARRVLAEELGVEPSAVTIALYEHIQAGAVTPVRVRSLTPPNNISAPLTSFIGREAELAAIRARLDNPECRLLTLVGTGGIGKTRLALRAASTQLNAFREGVYFVPLASLGSVEFIVPSIAGSLEFRFSGPEEPKIQLLSYLREKQMLLVLDNFEHLLDGADLVIEILEHAPEVKILATSRQPLDLQAEWLLHIQGLMYPESLPPPGPVEWSSDSAGREGYSAAQLFLERASRLDEHFMVDAASIIRVCQLVEGIPLAIELAAASVRSFSTQEIAAQISSGLDFLSTTMRDIETRHRSLRQVLDWSCALLSDAEQTVFRRLSVFAGGWTLEAAEAICAGEGIENQVLNLLTHLVDKSLVLMEAREGAARYRMLETIRQFAEEKLKSGEVEQVRSKHLAFFVWLAEEAEPRLQGAEQLVWLNRLETDRDNLRAALAWSLADEANGEMGLRLAGALWRFWYLRGYYSEGQKWLERALEKSSYASTVWCAKLLTGLGSMAWSQGIYQQASIWHQKALALYQELEDRQGIAFALNNLANASLYQGNYLHARMLYDESLALYREVSDKWGIAIVLGDLGMGEVFQGNYDEATRFYVTVGKLRPMEDTMQHVTPDQTHRANAKRYACLGRPTPGSH